jgi:hypothetical protein
MTQDRDNENHKIRSCIETARNAQQPPPYQYSIIPSPSFIYAHDDHCKQELLVYKERKRKKNTPNLTIKQRSDTRGT